MTETKERYHSGPSPTISISPSVSVSISASAPPPDTVLTVLEAIRDLADAELARIERHGGCCGFAERVRAEVGKVLR